jgi:hypothetical protein
LLRLMIYDWLLTINCIVTSVSTTPGLACLPLPFNMLPALIFIVHAFTSIYRQRLAYDSSILEANMHRITLFLSSTVVLKIRPSKALTKIDLIVTIMRVQT